jgi:hypothetical protein
MLSRYLSHGSTAFVAVEKQYVLHILSVCYPEWNAHAPYCQLWPARLYSIFRHYLINGTIFKESY